MLLQTDTKDVMVSYKGEVFHCIYEYKIDCDMLMQLQMCLFML